MRKPKAPTTTDRPDLFTVNRSECFHRAIATPTEETRLTRREKQVVDLAGRGVPVDRIIEVTQVPPRSVLRILDKTCTAAEFERLTRVYEKATDILEIGRTSPRIA